MTVSSLIQNLQMSRSDPIILSLLSWIENLGKIQINVGFLDFRAKYSKASFINFLHSIPNRFNKRFSSGIIFGLINLFYILFQGLYSYKYRILTCVRQWIKNRHDKLFSKDKEKTYDYFLESSRAWNGLLIIA